MRVILKGDTKGCEPGSGEGWGVGGKIKWRLSEVNTKNKVFLCDTKIWI